MASPNILKLKVDSSEYDSKIKRASQGLLHLGDSLKKTGKSFLDADKDQIAFVRELGKMETVSKTAKGSIGEMSKAFTDLRMQYKQMTDAERNSPLGKALNQSLNELKGRIQDTKRQLSDVDKELNVAKVETTDFSGVIGELGSKLGVSSELMGLLTTGTMGYAAAIGVSTTAAIAATKAWVEYNSELAKQTQITTVTTGLSGGDAGAMTDFGRSVASTYGVDFREVINAANTLMQQFGKSGEEAMQLIRDGMQGMIQGDGPKLLSMIQQYAPSFRDAGISASQLVAIIQNSEGGLFTAENMNAIVMGIKNIRLMTNSTSEALQKVGIDSEEMTKKLNDGSMTIFDAMRQVSEAIERTGSSSQAAGEVMQQVFGRQGTAAGTNLGEAIATLNTNLDETKRQTGSLGEEFAKLQKSSEDLENAMRECFGFTEIDDLEAKMKTTFYNALTKVLDGVTRLKGVWEEFENLVGRNVVANAFKVIATRIAQMLHPMMLVYDQAVKLFAIFGSDNGRGSGWMGRTGNFISSSMDKMVLTATGQTGGGGGGGYVPPAPTTGGGGRGGRGGRGGGGGRGTTPQKELTIQQQIAKLEKEALTATDERRAEIAKTVQELDKVLEKQKEITEELHKGAEVKKEYEGKGVFNGMPESTEFADSDTRSPSERMRDSVLAAMSDKAMAVDEETMRTLMQTSIENGIDGIDWDTINEMMWEGMDIPDDAWKRLQQQINEMLKSLGIAPIDIDFSTGKKKKEKKDDKKEDSTIGKEVTQIMGSVNSIVSGISSLGIEIPSGIAKVLAVMQTIVGIISVMEMILTIMGVRDQFRLFNNGGLVRAAGGTFVPGTNYSGDRVPALLNSGELVLNRSQQGVLANALSGNAFDNLELTASLNGEDIVFAIDNASRRRGKGTMVRLRNS